MSSTYNSNDLSFASGEATIAVTRSSIETVPATAPPADNPDSLGSQAIDTTVVLLSLLVTASWAFFVYLDYRKQAESLLLIGVRTSPCKNCRFFHSSDLLKCAVHPTRALTPEAENCQDYEPTANQKKAPVRF